MNISIQSQLLFIAGIDIAINIQLQLLFIARYLFDRYNRYGK